MCLDINKGQRLLTLTSNISSNSKLSLELLQYQYLDWPALKRNFVDWAPKLEEGLTILPWHLCTSTSISRKIQCSCSLSKLLNTLHPNRPPNPFILLRFQETPFRSTLAPQHFQCVSTYDLCATPRATWTTSATHSKRSSPNSSRRYSPHRTYWVSICVSEWIAYLLRHSNYLQTF